ncbi:MAG: hypothetical protein AAB438_03650 [Patescibacteria group bacterium]|mgnify:CR=1
MNREGPGFFKKALIGAAAVLLSATAMEAKNNNGDPIKGGKTPEPKENLKSNQSQHERDLDVLTSEDIRQEHSPFNAWEDAKKKKDHTMKGPNVGFLSDEN